MAEGGDTRPDLAARRAASPASASDPADPGPGDFSAERAWANLEALLAIGPRPAGSEAAEAASVYLGNRLSASGLEVETVELAIEAGPGEPRRVTSLLARLDGASPDLLLIAAPFTSPEREGSEIPGANEGGSGAAVALELARALAESDRPYRYLFAFVAGDGAGGDPIAGSRALAAELVRRGQLARVRAGLFLDRVGDADLRIARDLHSSAPLRDIVWARAEAHGYGRPFSSDAFDAPEGGHRALAEAGLRQLVALIDSSHGGGVPPGEYARSVDDDLAHCAPESLGIVGTVALDSLHAIEARFVHLDRYSASPAAATRGNARDREAASATAPSPAAEAAGDTP